jgi:mRNA-degrading endonuclease RelE of RelBE toxin-antitoxin system
MGTRFREVVRKPEFDRDLRGLTRRFASLEEDLELLVDTALFAFHKLGQDTGIVQISGLGRLRLPVFKARKFACRCLKGRGSRTGLRLIYAFNDEEDRIELVEIFFKTDQEIEDRERIRRYCSRGAP